MPNSHKINNYWKYDRPSLKWYYSNKEKSREMNRNWQKKNSKHVCEKVKKRYWENRDNIKQKHKIRYEKIGRYERPFLRFDLLKAFGGKCNKCGNPDIRILQLDHINGGGNKQREKGINFSTKTFYKKILKDLEYYKKEFQILCPNCNWIKRYENHEVIKIIEFEGLLG